MFATLQMVKPLRLIAVVLFSSLAIAQSDVAQSQPAATKVPAGRAIEVVKRFQDIRDITGEEFLNRSREGLWEIYPLAASDERPLLDYVRDAPDGPGLGFASIALIPFHDAAAVPVMIARARDPKTSSISRFYLLSAVPYVLGIGDAMYMGKGGLKEEETKDFLDGFGSMQPRLVQGTIGHTHALGLQELFQLDEKSKREEDYGLAIWHQSAYLVGTLDLRDLEILRPALDVDTGYVYANLANALCFATNHDFLKDFRERSTAPKEMQVAAAKTMAEWWTAYLRQHPDGDWHPAVREGFQSAGYHLGDDLHSAESQKELVRALNSKDLVIQYNALRLLNETNDTHFDPDVAFIAGKYALSFLDPSPLEQKNKARMQAYWTARINGKTASK